MDNTNQKELIVDSRMSIKSMLNTEVYGMPIYFFSILCFIVIAASYFGSIPKNMIGGLAIIMAFGYIFALIGRNVPLLKEIGGPAILCLLLPSIFTYIQIVPTHVSDAVYVLMKEANFLYFVIATLVVGSILGMNRVILVQGMIRMFIPLLVGTITSVIVGLLVGKLMGYSFYHTFFFIIVPIIGGGIGEGIIPLSIAYSAILGTTPDQFVAQLVPAAVVGNIFAIICAGFLARLGKKHPHLSGNGILTKSTEDKALYDLSKRVKNPTAINFQVMGSGFLLVCCFFILGGLLEKLVHIPGPVLMIVLAVLCKYLHLVPNVMEEGAKNCYSLISSALIWPTMIGLGLLYVPLESVASVFSIEYFVVCASVVLSMAAISYFIAPYLNMYPVEASIVTTCHSGLGGTGDVAILSASNRMSLMPFAQISTRIGGAATVILASILLGFFH
ncbi:2-hydroxycarboxylate transporter family protein [Acinetobacter pittii]